MQGLRMYLVRHKREKTWRDRVEETRCRWDTAARKCRNRTEGQRSPATVASNRHQEIEAISEVRRLGRFLSAPVIRLHPIHPRFDGRREFGQFQSAPWTSNAKMHMHTSIIYRVLETRVGGWWVNEPFPLLFFLLGKFHGTPWSFWNIQLSHF